MLQQTHWRNRLAAIFGWTLLLLSPECPGALEPPAWDTFSDTWTATDALERRLPGFTEAGPVRSDHYVGMFYFLWLGQHVVGGPHDIARILSKDPAAMDKPESPLWGPLHAPHHWGESIFGYYQTQDPYVLRKHCQMLADAGVDVLIFDVTNQLAYRSNYMELLRVFTEVRRQGGKTPQVAFLCPFWDPAKVAGELYRDLYAPGLYPDLWFRWQGKPLILADPELLNSALAISPRNQPEVLKPGHTLGQTFSMSQPWESVSGSFPTWSATNSAVTLTLYETGPGGRQITARRFERVRDNDWLQLRLDQPQPPGVYYLEASAPNGTIGWWSHTQDVFAQGQAFADGQPAAGDRQLRIASIPEEVGQMRKFFTFRKPQPDYFQGATQPDMWSWLEVFPQHIFRNARGEKEQMSVGVAQNAVSNRLGCLSEPGALGRSYRGGTWSREPGAIQRGFNFTEQWEHALRQDPQFIFVTGWNEWIAGRFNEFNGVRRPVMFVDEFDQENSRDIEPMKGGHGDNYYYQLVSYIRRYKGVRPNPQASPPKTIILSGDFSQWAGVTPEFRDDAGDVQHRDFPGFNQCARYVNQSGRNDLLGCKATQDAGNLYFYIRTAQPLTAPATNNWMTLLLDIDCDHRTGWEGYDFILNHRLSDSSSGWLEKNAGGWNWAPVTKIPWVARGSEMHLAIPKKLLGLPESIQPVRLDFKWADNFPESGQIIDLLDQGDTAPNGRFNYRFESAGNR